MTTLSDIAKILYLISETPNIKPDPMGDSTKSVFDGGSIKIVTGLTEWEFSNGAKAYSVPMPYENLRITFPDGMQVKISNQS